MRAGRRPPRQGSGAAAPAPVEEGAFEALRDWRMQRAAGLPAFTVAANAVLEEILRQRPASVAELIEIHGVGPAFCEKHGESLLEALAGIDAGAGVAQVSRAGAGGR